MIPAGYGRIRLILPAIYMATPDAGSISSSPKARSCSGVGLASMVKAWSGLPGSATSFSVSVARSARSVSMPLTGSPSGARLVSGLGLRAFRDLGRLHRRAPLRPGALAAIVPGQHRREAAAHVPFHAASEHAHEHMRPHAVLRVHMHRPDLQPRGPERPERPLHAGEASAVLHRRLRAHGRRIQAGADEVDAVGPGLLRDPLPAALPVHPSVARGDAGAPVRFPAAGLPPQGLQRPVAAPLPRLPARGGGDLRERPFRLLKRLLPFPPPPVPQPRVEADHEPPAGKVRAGDLRHGVLLQRLRVQRGRGVRAGGLQGPADVCRLQGRYPVEARGPDILTNAGRGQHPPIPDQRHPVDAEAPADLRDLRRRRGRVAGVSRERLHGHGAAVRRAERPAGDPELSLLPVAAVAEGRGRAAPALQAA